MASIIKTTTLNCAGLLDFTKRSNIFRRLITLEIDIAFLQEIHSSDANRFNQWADSVNYMAFFSPGINNKSCGVAILIRKSLDFKLNHFRPDPEGRVAQIDCLIYNSPARLVCIYAPNIQTHRKEFFRLLPLIFATTRPLICGGDYNVIENLFLDKTSHKKGGDEGFDILKAACDDYNLIDIFRVKWPDKIAFSFERGNIKSRLDKFYISRVLEKDVRNIDYIPCDFSDHNWLDLSFSLPKISIDVGKGFWKLNVSILDRPEVVAAIESAWHNEIQPQLYHDGVWWDEAKRRFKNILIDVSSSISRESKVKLKCLEDELLFYTELNYNSPITNLYSAEIEAIKAEISDFIMQKNEGAKIRSKANFLENSEKPTRYFLKREAVRTHDKIIKELFDNEENCCYDDIPNITRICRNFYSHLFTSEEWHCCDDNVRDDFLSDLPQLSQSDSDKCEGYLDFEECLEAIKGMSNCKTPGKDGLPKEFYQKFFYLFGPDFVAMINMCYDLDKLTPSQREAILSLLVKDPKMRIHLSYYRPISLLNCDYKIVAKCLANRAKKVLPMIIHPDQSCSIPKRTITDNCHLLRNVIDLCEMRNIPAALLGLDQLKAFDRVEFNYLFSALEAFGFGHGFVKWIRVLYNDCSCQVLVNGFLADPYRVLRGIRQGCPLSSILYVICIEPLLVKIRSDPNIRGLSPPSGGNEIKLTAYADDNNPIVTDIPSISRVINVATQFGLASGGRLNLNKSTGTLLGAAKQWSLPPHVIESGIKWVPFSKMLGCRLGVCDVKKENWELVLEKTQKAFNEHSSRSLSLNGKAVVVNAVIFSKLWYVGKIITLNTHYLDKLYTQLRAFNWNIRSKDGERTQTIKLARETLCLRSSDGGVGLVDVRLKLQAFRIMHIIDFLYGPWHPWKDIATYWISMDLRQYKTDLFTNASPHALRKPKFYAICVKNFVDFRNKHPEVLLTSMTTKSLYNILLDDFDHIPKIVEKHPGTDYTLIFPHCNDKHYDPHVRALTFKIVHEIIGTKENLFKINCKGGSISSVTDPYCPSCPGVVESSIHVFCRCPVTSRLWSVVQDLLFGLCNHRLKPDKQMVCFNIFPTVLAKQDIFIAKQVVGLAKFAIWKMRNSRIFERRRANEHDLLNLFLCLLKSRVLADNHRWADQKFRKHWCHKNIICAKSGSSVEFII